MTRLHIVIPVLFLIALTSCIAATDSYSDQSPEFIFSPVMAQTQAAMLPGAAAPLPTRIETFQPTHTPAPTNTPTETPVPTNTPTNTPAPTNTPVPG